MNESLDDFMSHDGDEDVTIDVEDDYTDEAILGGEQEETGTYDDPDELIEASSLASLGVNFDELDADDPVTAEELAAQMESGGKELPQGHPLRMLPVDEYLTARHIEAIKNFENDPARVAARVRQGQQETIDEIFPDDSSLVNDPDADVVDEIFGTEF